MTSKEKILSHLKEIGCCGGDYCQYDHDGDLQQFVSTSLDTYAKQQVEEFKKELIEEVEKMCPYIMGRNEELNEIHLIEKSVKQKFLSLFQEKNSTVSTHKINP